MLGNAIVGVVGRSVRGVPRCFCVACKLAQRHVSTLREGQVLSEAASPLSLQISCLFQQVVLISRLCLSTTACYEHPHAMILQLLLLLFPLAVEGRLKGFDTLVNLVLDECTEYMRGIAQPCKPADARINLHIDCAPSCQE